MRQALLPGAEGEGEEDEEESAEHENSSRRAHAGHRPGELVVHGDGVVGGQQGQDGLVEDQDTQQDQHTCTQGPGSRTAPHGMLGVPTCQNEAEGGRFKEEGHAFIQRHGDADGAHRHHGQAQKRQNGCG